MSALNRIQNAVSISGGLSSMIPMWLDHEPKVPNGGFSNLPTFTWPSQLVTRDTVKVPARPLSTVVDLDNYRITREMQSSIPSASLNTPATWPSFTVTASARASSLAALWRRIESFSTLPADWFGEGCLLPGASVIGAARHILNELPRHVRLPQATASGDGEIGLTWFNGPDRLDVTVSPEGYLSWAMKFRGKFLKGDYVDQDAAGRSVLFAALDNFYE